MVFQKLIKFNKDETTAEVRNRKGITYTVPLSEDVSTSRAKPALERGWTVDACVRWYGKTPFVVSFLVMVPEKEYFTKEEVAQQKLEYETLGGEY
jgi:hypothetical protein